MLIVIVVIVQPNNKVFGRVKKKSDETKNLKKETMSHEYQELVSLFSFMTNVRVNSLILSLVQ